MKGPTVTERTFYLEGEHPPSLAVFHAADPACTCDTAVILCGPFGWEEICSYRSLRAWARGLAAAGYPTLRVTPPGTGDSAGTPRDPGQLEAWSAAFGGASAWLKASTGAARLTAIGISLGGMVAYRATAAGAPIDDLVLWATPARGRSYLRQLRAFAKLELAECFQGLPQPPPLPEGELEAGGFIHTAPTVADLDRLDLTALPLPHAARRRVLLLERDGISVDANLREALERAGAQVNTARGEGYGEMTAHPQTARPPSAVMKRVLGWLREIGGETSGPAGTPALERPNPAQHSRLVGEVGPAVRERPFMVEQPWGRLAGILTEPGEPQETGLCVVLLNAGAVRRIGPNRMWVEAARRWAGWGIPCLRLDVQGIGDADGDATPYAEDGDLYLPELVPQVLAALDQLEREGIGDRFVLSGLCAGAYWSFHAALGDVRVQAALMVNPRALIWSAALAPARDFRALMSERASLAKVRQEVSLVRVLRIAMWMLSAPKRWLDSALTREARGSNQADEVDALLARMIASGKRMLLLFACNEPLDEELVRSGHRARLEQAETVTLERILVTDHTLRPNWAQHQAHEILDRAIRREQALSRIHAPISTTRHAGVHPT